MVAAETDEAAPRPLTWQFGPARAISLEDAVAYAQAHQPSLKAALDRVKVAQADAEVPRAAWLPRSSAVAELVEGTANNTTASYIATQDMALPRIGATRTVDSGTWGPSPSTLAAISIGQELFDFGRIGAQSAAADAAVVTERRRAEAERLAIALIVKESYFAVQGAKAVLRAAKDGYERTKVHRDMAEAGVRTGLFAPIERTRAEADLARFEVALQGVLARRRCPLTSVDDAVEEWQAQNEADIPVGNVRQPPAVVRAHARAGCCPAGAARKGSGHQDVGSHLRADCARDGLLGR